MRITLAFTLVFLFTYPVGASDWLLSVGSGADLANGDLNQKRFLDGAVLFDSPAGVVAVKIDRHAKPRHRTIMVGLLDADGNLQRDRAESGTVTFDGDTAKGKRGARQTADYRLLQVRVPSEVSGPTEVKVTIKVGGENHVATGKLDIPSTKNARSLRSETTGTPTG